MSAIIFLIILSILIIIHEFGHFIMARRSGVKVEIFSLGFGPKLIKKKVNDTEFCICLVPFGGYVKLAGDNWREARGKPWEYLSQSVFKRIKIVFFGAFLNYVFAFLFFWLIFFLGYPTLLPKVGELMPGYPAQEAGIKVDDTIIALNGIKVETWEKLQNIIHAKKGQRLELSVKREDKRIEIIVTPRNEEVKGLLGERQKVGLIGIRPKGDSVFIRHNFIEACGLGFRRLLSLSAMTYKSIFYMLTGKISAKEAVTGPLGMFHITEGALRYGVVAVMHIMAIISMSLAIVNLLPIPVLDGGHIFFLLLEKLRKRPLNRRLEEIINQTAMYILFFLFVLVIINDFTRYGYWEKIAKLLFR